MTVGVHVLSQQRNLFHAALSKAFHLTADFSQRPAPLPPTPVRDDAIGAEVITALDDGDKSARWRWQRGGVLDTFRSSRPGQVQKLGGFPRLKEKVNMRKTAS